MSLVRLSRVLWGASIAGTLLILLLGGLFFQRMWSAQQSFSAILELQQDIGALSVASDTLMLHPASPEMYTAVREEAVDIARRLRAVAVDHPDAVGGIAAIELILELLDEIAMSAGAATTGPGGSDDGQGPLGLSLREQTLLTQMAAHGVALDGATSGAVESLRRDLVADGVRIALTFGFGALGFALLTSIALTLLHCRVAGPVQRLAKAVRAVEAGDRTVRAPETPADELGDLGRALNAMVAGLDAAVDQLRSSQAILRVAGKTARLGGWRWPIGGERVLWSDETAAILDEPPSTHPPLPQALSYFPPADGERLARLLDDCAKRGEPYDVVLAATTATGRAIEARVIGEAEFDAAGRIVAVRGAFQDVTEQRALDARLHQAEKLETVGQLTGGIAHDFNNLLTIIVGNAELLVDASSDRATRESAGVILEAAERGAALTGNLLAFSRRQPLDPRPTDLNVFIAANAMLFGRGVHEGIELRFQLDATHAVAVVDPNKLQAALLNLVVNSRDAIDGHGTVVIETADAVFDASTTPPDGELAPGGYVIVAVSDDGAGMPPEIAANAFDPFFTTKPAGAGTGLGLSSVYGFAKQSRGHARIYSEVGQGTSVKIFLPRAEEPPAVRDAPAEAATASRGRGEHLLVVEDDSALRAHATLQLERLGYRVSAVASADEALDVLAAHPDVALLFTDVIMPGGMNGRELAEVAKARRPSLEVLFTSGYTKNAIVHHGRLEPGIELLSKPYRVAELARRIRARLGP